MAKRAGEIITYGGTTLVNRLQSVGPSSINVPSEQIYETGNADAVTRLYDTPDLSFDMECYDMTTAPEEKLLRLGSLPDGGEIDLNLAQPLYVVSPWLKRKGSTDVNGGTIIPFLTVESYTIRAGVQANATKQMTLRGDQAFYVPPDASPRYQEFTKNGVGPYLFDDTARENVEAGATRYALDVCVYNVDGTYRRLIHGASDDYTDNTNGFTLTAAAAAEFPNGAQIAVVYAAEVIDTILPAVHPDPDTVPGALKYYNVELWVGDGAATPTLAKWNGVQSVEASWRVSLEKDNELGNRRVVEQDYDTPEVSGNVVMRPRTAQYFIDRLAQINGTNADHVQSLENPTPLEVEMVFKHPTTAAILETVYIPDALFNVPPVQARIRQKLDVTFPLFSDSGQMFIYKGARP